MCRCYRIVGGVRCVDCWVCGMEVAYVRCCIVSGM